jgi:hypothetical protein
VPFFQQTAFASSAAPESAPDSSARRAACVLLLVVAGSITGARILTAPFAFSVNDQSRWSTIRALADTGTYAIGRRYEYANRRYQDVGIVSEPDWFTIDVVMHPTTRRLYSSKPTLLPTLLAGEYWLLREMLGWRITDDRLAVSRTILLTINWLPFVLYLILFGRLAERLGATDWGRLFVFSAACFGTFVSGFLAGLNNHTVAATAALFAVYHCLQIHLDDDCRWWRFLLAGLFAGWAACNELPAAALAAGLVLWLARLSWPNTLRFALPAMLVPVAAYLYVQYEAFGWVVPTYAQKEWYEFPGSYWLNPVGVDRADDGKLLYAFNFLVGHTGILALTPVLLIGWIGMARGVRLNAWKRTDLTPRVALASLTLALTGIVLLFYVLRTNDYGGATAGPRWFFWLNPLWLLTMLPEADRWAALRWRRAVAYLLLAISIGSAMYALANPWRHSWLFVTLHDWGIISYY